MVDKFHLVFGLMFVGYMIIVYDRQSISYAAPTIAKEENLQSSDLGLIISCQHLGYMLVKTVAGTLADTVDPGLLFSLSIFLTGSMFACFTTSPTVLIFMVFSFLCGVAQGPTWGACAVLLDTLVATEQFATWWGVLSVSSNVAGTVGPFLSAVLIDSFGWKATLITAGTVSMAWGGLSFLVLKVLAPDARTTKSKDLAAGSQNQRLLDVFTVKLGLVFVPYMLASVVRGACSDWGVMYLVSVKAQSSLTGSSFSSSNEIGGIIGSVVAGYVADKMVKKTESSRSRYIVCVALTALQSVGLILFVVFTSSHSSQIWISFLAFLIGFGQYGSITLFGVLAMEVAPVGLAGTSHSAVLVGSNLGRVFAGYPLSLIATWMTWQESFMVVVAVSCFSFTFMTLGLNLMGTHQKTS